MYIHKLMYIGKSVYYLHRIGIITITGYEVKSENWFKHLAWASDPDNVCVYARMHLPTA